MLRGIHYLRGIAALIIVLFHFRGTLNNIYSDPKLGITLLQAGASGVDIFFLISGFIIVIASQNKSTNNPRSFLIRRALRIYPALILCWFFGSMTIYSSQPPLELFKSVIPVNRDYNLAPPTFGFNLMGPPWTLTYEILFYLVFCIAISLNHKHRALIASAIMLTSIVSINLIFNGALSISAANPLMIDTSSQWAGALKLISSTYFLEFIAGMALAAIYLNKNICISKNVALAIFTICFGAFSFMFITNFNPGFGPQGYGIWAIALVTGVVALEKAKINIPANSVLSYLGDISYSMYISHYLIIGIFYKYNPPIWSDLAGFSQLLFVTLTTLVIASTIYYLVEKPFIALGKRWLEQTRSRDIQLVG